MSDRKSAQIMNALKSTPASIRLFLLPLLVAFVASVNVHAGMMTMTAQLTGDPRPDNPDGLVVDVTVTYEGAVSDWVIDINSPTHKDIKLGAFFFNLDVVSSKVEFDLFSPEDWVESSPANNAQGSGSADFLFEVSKEKGSADDVTLSNNLMFRATLLDGLTWSDSMFLNAPTSTSNDDLLNEVWLPEEGFQLGAHLQSLVAEMGQSDSGFAVGFYTAPTPPPGPAPVPEPGSFAIFFAMMSAAGMVQRRRRSTRNA